MIKAIFKIFSIPRNSPLIVLTEHLGDIVAATPIAKAVYEKHNIKPVWIVNRMYKEVLVDNPYVDLLCVQNLGESALILSLVSRMYKTRPIYNCHFDNRLCTQTKLRLKNKNIKISVENYYNYGSLLNGFSLIAGISVIDRFPDIFKSNDYVEENRILIHPKSNEELRNCNDRFWVDLVVYLLKNTIYDVWLIGKPVGFNINHERFVNYSGFREMKDIIRLIQSSILFIGVDSGFAHLANSMRKNSIIILNQKYKSFEDYNPFEGHFSEEFKSILFRIERTDLMEFVDFREHLENKLSHLS